MGKRIGATGTPTIVVNGMRYARPLQAGELERVIGELLDR
jgi:protein-disulfide isomerase